MATWDEMPSENFLAAFDAPLSARQVFIRKTYGLFTLAIAAGGVGSWLVAQSAVAVNFATQASIICLVAWYALQFLQGPIARAGKAAHYAFLGAFVVIVSLFTGPMAYYFVGAGAADILVHAFGLASLTFGGLTAYVFVTKKDFSWIGGALTMGFFLIIGILLISVFVSTPPWMGIAISAGIIALTAGMILYETSHILHHYSTDMAPMAAARLFISFAVLFWNIARILYFSRD